MAVVAGVDKPTAAQYNSIQTTIQTVFNYYGNTASSSQLALPGTSTKITSAAWSNLRNDILKCDRHQQASPNSLDDPTTSTKVSAAIFNSYETLANSCLTNYLLDSGNYDTVNNLTTISHNGSSPGGPWGRTGRNTLRHTFILTWANDSAANYFFNAGGKIRISSTATGGTTATVGTKDYSWKSLVNTVGTVSLGYSVWSTLGGSISQQYTRSSSTYTPNVYKIFANKSASNAIQFYIEWEDLNDPGGTYTIDEDVSATITSTIEEYYASGVGQIDVSGYQPTISNSAIGPLPSPDPA
jgi:hypothetical protein